MTDLLHIDGSHGEGGGQIVRSSLALSVLTGRGVVIENVRAGREKPGLMRQHVTSVQAAAEICKAEVEGDTLGSTRLVFMPGPLRAGEYEFRIGTAGSTTLVLQTVLPALMFADGPSTLVLEGGTHNPHAPPFDFLAGAYLPLVHKIGPRVAATLECAGFYPAGGGRIKVQIQPAQDGKLTRMELHERGPIVARSTRALLANLPRHIGERECQTVLKMTGWDPECARIEEIQGSRGPGNIMLVELQSENVTEVFTGFGQYGVKAEAVAEEAVRQMRQYLAAEVPVGEHLADQLLLPLGISAARSGAGGSFRTQRLSRHSTTHIEVLKHFLDLRIDVQREDGDACLVRVEPA